MQPPVTAAALMLTVPGEAATKMTGGPAGRLTLDGVMDRAVTTRPLP